MAKKTNYLPWIIGGVAAWFLLKKTNPIQGIGGYKKSAINNLENYILSNIVPMHGEIINTKKEKLNYLIDYFINTQKNGIKKFGFDNALYIWLQSKPMILNIAYYYGQIAMAGYDLGLLNPDNTTEKKEQNFEDKWLKLIADTISDMYKIDHIKSNG